MALKKSQIYSSLWKSCDELRGGMDASQYKDYVLTLLFVKYVSDRYAGDPLALLVVPEGGSFADIVRLKGDKEIGDKINKIIARLAEANDLKGVIDQADFADESKLGRGKEMQDRLSKLISIFEDIDLRTNRAEGDDLLGDAYEYLMRHFATQSGKSKGQFYTPAEVSRVMAKVVGIGVDTSPDQTIYDPTCGSGSLLLRAANEAPRGISIYGQEIDNTTWSLAKMNMILHGYSTAELWRGNTLAAPHFKNPDGSLKTFDFAVANPPFSQKNWTNGLDPAHDEYGRFEYGIPPTKNGDYAFLLHIIKSLKSTGKAAVILPHGVLFRGNSEANIRRNLVCRGLIKGIIGLPPNLFYGTSIPACIIVIDKENSHTRKGIFMIDASRGFIKDGNKNRLREQDIRKIVDVFNHGLEIPRYSRMVPFSEIEANDFNLNIPRYIDSSDPEDLHDLGAHLHGGIPQRDVDDLRAYWEVFPSLRDVLFAPGDRPGYLTARVEPRQLKQVIRDNPDFRAYAGRVREVFDAWKKAHAPTLYAISQGSQPTEIIRALGDDLLARFADMPLLDKYDVYQRLMDYWNETMQDDLYLISAEGWMAGRNLRAAYEKETPDISIKRGQKTSKYVGDLIPARLVIARFFAARQAELDRLQSALQQATAKKEAFEEEHGSDGGALEGLEGAKGNITKENVQTRVMELKHTIMRFFDPTSVEYAQAKRIKKETFGKDDWPKGMDDEEGLFAELDTLFDYLQMLEQETNVKSAYQDAEKALYEAVIQQYSALTEDDIKALVIEDKWLAALRSAIDEEVGRVAQRLTARIKELEERYAEPLPQIEAEVAALSARVAAHLARMGLTLD